MDRFVLDNNSIAEILRICNEEGLDIKPYKAMTDTDKRHCTSLYNQSYAYDELEASTVLMAFLHKGYHKLLLQAIDVYMDEAEDLKRRVNNL